MENRTIEVKTDRGVIQVTYMPVTVEDVREHEHKEEVDQAQIRQTLVKHYPGGRANNSMTEDMYGVSEYGFESTDYEETRVAWINIPKGKTKQDVEAQLAKHPNATIYKILADNVESVLTAEQLHAIDSPKYDYTLENAKCGHVICVADENGMPTAISKKKDENGDAIFLPGAVEVNETGKVVAILNEKGLQYSSKGFALNATPDEDLREKEGAPAEKPLEVVDEAKTPAGAL